MRIFNAEWDSLIFIFTHDGKYSIDNIDALAYKYDNLQTKAEIIAPDICKHPELVRQIEDAAIDPINLRFQPSARIAKFEFVFLINEVRNWNGKFSKQAPNVGSFLSLIERKIADLLANFETDEHDFVSLEGRKKLGDIGNLLLLEISRVEKAEIEEEGVYTSNIDGFLKIPMGRAIEILNNRYRNAKAINIKIDAIRGEFPTDVKDEISSWIDLIKENVELIYSDNRYLRRLEWYYTAPH